MSVSFYSITTFRNSLNNLRRKERDGYVSCAKDIASYFAKYSFEDIWEMKSRYREFENIRLIKVRLQDSHQKLSKADGYRLIIGCNKKNHTVTFLNIYPKRGKQAQLDQSKEQYKEQLKLYLSSLKENTLIQHNINKELEELIKVDKV